MAMSAGTGGAGRPSFLRVCRTAHVFRIGAPPGPAPGPHHVWVESCSCALHRSQRRDQRCRRRVGPVPSVPAVQGGHDKGVRPSDIPATLFPHNRPTPTPWKKPHSALGAGEVRWWGSFTEGLLSLRVSLYSPWVSSSLRVTSTAASGPASAQPPSSPWTRCCWKPTDHRGTERRGRVLRPRTGPGRPGTRRGRAHGLGGEGGAPCTAGPGRLGGRARVPTPHPASPGAARRGDARGEPPPTCRSAALPLRAVSLSYWGEVGDILPR